MINNKSITESETIKFISDDDKHFLKITNLNAKFKGRLTFLASNFLGSVSKSFDLDILCKK